MEESAFERLARAVAVAGTRRRVLAFLSGLPVAGLIVAADDDTEAGAQGRRGRRHRAQHEHRHVKTARRTAQRDAARTEACIPTGQRCPSKKPQGKHVKKLSCKHCCQLLVVTDAGGKKVCGCQPNGAKCGDASSFACCSGYCNGTSCQTPPSPPSPPCSQTCAGCCDGSGMCQAGINAGVCGAAGTSCSVCSGTKPICQSG